MILFGALIFVLIAVLLAGTFLIAPPREKPTNRQLRRYLSGVNSTLHYRKRNMNDQQSMTIVITVVPIGGGQTVMLGNQRLSGLGGRYIAATNLAGITLRGSAADDPLSAVKALLWEMTSGSTSQTAKDAEVALGLAIENRDVTDLAPKPPDDSKPQLTNGDDDAH